MPLDILVGAQWGDEGKGRITDLLAEDAQIVARYSGGDNAGHTVTVGAQLYKLHLLPSGVIQPRVISVLGNGMVINPARLLAEMEKLQSSGVDVSPTRIKISHAAHLITPAHIALDKAEEAARAEGKIGTTGRGIGPAYTDKIARHGLRAELLLNPEQLGDAVHEHIRQTNRTLENIYAAPPLDASLLAAEFAAHAQRLAPYITDTALYLHQQLQAGARVIAEGAQGTLLDIDHGTYPFVTSSSPSAGGVFLHEGPDGFPRDGLTAVAEEKRAAGARAHELGPRGPEVGLDRAL
ncbi:MAG: adenylosuccinate synthetase, partial [Anaerolineales bacterium]|nr:adenylosuccinate synthetase [Anaerolineales bacterium]